MSTNAHLASLTLLRDIRRRELDVLDARLEEARHAHASALVRWTSCTSRPLVPLVATMVSLLAANTALLCGFGIMLTGCREPFVNALFTLTTLIALIMLPFAGRAEPWLKRLAFAFLVLSITEVAYAAYELEGVGFPMPR